MARLHKPIELKRLQGTYRKDRDTAPPLPDMGTLQKPDTLTKRGQQAWNYLLPMVEEMGCNHALYSMSFAGLCEVWGLWRMVQESEDATAKQRDRMHQMVIRHLKEFGLTPAARAKVLAAN